METFELTGYHGTDLGVANNIVKSNFSCKFNKEHWLGQGIYLYIDKSLAKWWTTKPTRKHGTEITNPAIIECKIEVDESKVLNLCTLEGYKKYIDLYNSFLQDWMSHRKSKNEISFKEFRCVFFNYVLIACDIDVIIAPFVLPDQPYMPKYANEQFGHEMHILYTEVQVCIKESKQYIIKSKTII